MLKKMTYLKAIESANGIGRMISNRVVFPVSLASKVRRNYKNLLKGNESYEEVRKEILERYAEEREGNISYKPGMKEICLKELRELLDTEFETTVEMLSASELEKVEMIAVDDMLALDFMMED